MGAVAMVVEGIRGLIRSHELLPGEPIRQLDMAARLGVSRGPVREALEAMRNEGMVRHKRNQGYFVAKFGARELDQIVLMLRVLETSLLEHLEWPDEDRLAEIADINDRLDAAARENDLPRVVELNRQFHEAIFTLAPLEEVHSVVRRLWDISDSYRALYFTGPARLRMAAEHQEILDALGRRDRERLVDAIDRHRRMGHTAVMAMLGGKTLLN